jgi:hypothetical protein
VSIAFGAQQCNKIVVYFNGAYSALGLRFLDLFSVFSGVFDRPFNAQRLRVRIKVIPTQRQNFIAPGPVNAATATIGKNTVPLKPWTSVRS